MLARALGLSDRLEGKVYEQIEACKTILGYYEFLLHIKNEQRNTDPFESNIDNDNQFDKTSRKNYSSC